MSWIRLNGLPLSHHLGTEWNGFAGCAALWMHPLIAGRGPANPPHKSPQRNRGWEVRNNVARNTQVDACDEACIAGWCNARCRNSLAQVLVTTMWQPRAALATLTSLRLVHVAPRALTEPNWTRRGDCGGTPNEAAKKRTVPSQGRRCGRGRGNKWSRQEGESVA